jgi:flagellar hook-basal body complex protein FliE
MPIDPSFAVAGPEWQVAPVEPAQPAQPASGGFGDMLGDSIQSLTTSQVEASEASRELATGQASDPTQVVMAVERAQLAMQMAAQMRDKAVEATQTIFHTQV